MRAIVFALAALPMFVASVRLPTPGLDGAAPPARRIQYLHRNLAGLQDRLSVFTFLNNLAHYHHATAHIRGAGNARAWLHPEHSPESIAENWSFYLDTNSNDGNPFHEVDDKLECRRIRSGRTDWSRIFDHGGNCVNILVNYHRCCKHIANFNNALYAPKFSANVHYTAEVALKTTTRPFGVLHVRRCDLLSQNVNCTDPDRVKAFVSAKGVPSWLVFTYAEIGYLPNLVQKLNEVENTRFQYEDSLLSDVEPKGDNYLKYATVVLLQSMADKLIELRECKTASLATSPGMLDMGTNETANGWLEAAFRNRGVCDPRLGHWTKAAKEAKAKNHR